MAPKEHQCPNPGCTYKTDPLEAELAIRFLEILESAEELKMEKAKALDGLSSVVMNGVADSGCSIMCSGVQLLHKLGIPRSNLIKSNVSLKVADGRPLTVLGAVVPVDVPLDGRPDRCSKQLLHITSELKSLFISKSCLMDLGAISPSFPMPPPGSESVAVVGETDTSSNRAPCGCLLRSETPDHLKYHLRLWRRMFLRLGSLFWTAFVK